MYYDDYDLIPKVGIKDIRLGMKFNDVIAIIERDKIPYDIEIEFETDSVTKTSWTYINIKNYMAFVFAKNILWKIEADEEYKGKLPNGIRIGTNIKDALKIDDTLEFEDWDEVYISQSNEYLVEDECEFSKIFYFAIGIKEMFIEPDCFCDYKWVKKYE